MKSNGGGWNRGLKQWITKGSYALPNRTCETCSVKFHVKQSQIDVGKGKYCSRKCYMVQRSKWMKDKSINPVYKIDFSLSNNPNWKGGKSYECYPVGWSRTFKEQIRRRDLYKCQMCDVPESECYEKLHVHHIDYVKININPDNLISLCRSCHMKTGYNRESWTQHFLSRKEVENEYVRN